jgi:hypothetical protein
MRIPVFVGSTHTHRHAENAQESGAAGKNLRGLRATVCLEEKMGKGLGRGEVLL